MDLLKKFWDNPLIKKLIIGIKNFFQNDGTTPKNIQSQQQQDFYIPKSLSEIELVYDNELIFLLSEANNQIGKLDGIALNLPDRDLFISKYVEKEAVVSSQIEGTQASLSDVFQMNKIGVEKRKETEEIAKTM